MVNAAFSIYKTSVYLGSYVPTLYKDLRGLIGLISFAIYTSFRLFGNKISNDGKLLSKKHPHPKLRRKFMSTGMISLLQLKLSLGRINEKEMYSLAQSVVEGVVEAENAFNLLTIDSKILPVD